MPSPTRRAPDWQALFRIGDEVRPESAALIAELLAAGRKVVLLTGDAPAVARRVADQLGITDVRAGVTPQGKHDYVTALQACWRCSAQTASGCWVALTWV